MQSLFILGEKKHKNEGVLETEDLLFSSVSIAWLLVGCLGHAYISVAMATHHQDEAKFWTL